MIEALTAESDHGSNGDHFEMKIMTALKPASFSFAMVLLLCLGAFAQKADIVYLNTKGVEKEDKNARISSWTYKGCEFKGRTRRNVSASSLVSVTFTNSPEIYEEAVATMEDGNYRQALPLFQMAIDGKDLSGKDLKKSQLWCQEHAYYRAWVISRAMGDMGRAQSLRDDLLKAHPKTSYLPEVELRQAADEYAFGNFDKAIKAYNTLSDQTSSRGYASHYAVQAGVGVVRSHIAAKRYDQAAQAQAATATKALNESSRLQVELAKGEVLVAQKKIGAAQSLYQQLIKKLDYLKQPALFAGAANGLGDCLYASAKYKEAMFEYSKTFALFAGQDGMDHEIGWALWRFANCNNQLAAKADGEPEKILAFRYKKSRDRVSEEYRLSRGGQIARREKGMSK